MDYLCYKDKIFNGFYEEEKENSIKITKELKDKIFSSKENLKFKIDVFEDKEYGLEDFENLFEIYIVNIPKEPTPQDKFNADLLKQNADLLIEVKTQKELNSQILLELAKLKGGNTNV